MRNFDLDTSLIELNGNSVFDSWTIRHAVEGTAILGSIGSGKTSGSGRMIALKFLKQNLGGLVLAAKVEEVDLWKNYCTLTGRSHDLIIVEPGGKHAFDFLAYEAKRFDNGASITENIVHVLKTVIRAGEEKSGQHSDDRFWDTALDMLIFNTVDLCRLAYGKVSVLDIYNIVQSIPRSLEELTSDRHKDNVFRVAFESACSYAEKKADLWQEGIETDRLKDLIEKGRLDDELRHHVPEYRTLHYLDQFFIGNFIPLSEKTRSIIEYSFSGFLYRLLREPVYSLFCANDSTFEPEDCLRGKIIVLNLPVKIYDKAGRDCQILFKYIWQRAMERRDSSLGNRPVFLWADEAQHFLHEHDSDYQATARSSRICTVYISQNLPNYYANMGGNKSDYRVKSFLGTLNTKIFHANADTETNLYASALFGDVLFEKTSLGNSIGVQNVSRSSNTSTEFERAVRPEKFIRLKTGGPKNDYVVEGYMHRQGNPFASGANYSKVAFNQNSNT
jgi:TraM recognition site of TraD and TraG